MADGDAPDSFADDFFEQILSAPGEAVFVEQNLSRGGSMGLQLGFGSRHDDGSVVSGGGFLDSIPMAMQLGLKPEHTSGAGNASSSVVTGLGGSPELTNLFPAFGQPQPQGGGFPIAPPLAAIRPQQPLQPFHTQPTPGGVAGIRPRVRARRGQATDPHSIAERLRRERIADRMKALQELVPSANKADRASMLDDIVDYVKFLRLQVKVLSMSRVGATGAVAQLVADEPLSSNQGEEGGKKKHKRGWEKLGGEGIEEEVAKLMEEDVGAAMQLLQSKSLCIMPISLASAIFPPPPS